MARLGSLMAFLFQLIICFILLLITQTAAPKLQPIIYTAAYFFILMIIFNTIFIPFMQEFALIFQPFMNPIFKLTIESACYYLIASAVTEHFEQIGYSSLARLTHLTAKILILTLWLAELRQVIEALAQLKL